MDSEKGNMYVCEITPLQKLHRFYSSYRCHTNTPTISSVAGSDPDTF